MPLIRRTRLWLCALIAACIPFFAQAQAQAQSFPDRPVHIIVGVSPGGAVDNTARVLAQHLSALWGQPVIVETRLGAAGAVANEFVAKAPPDGYTLLVTNDNITALSALRSDLPYNLLHDLLPVSLVATSSTILVVNPSLPAHNLKELIALAKSEPGKLTYGSPGVGSITHLETARFASLAGINIVHVPYQGTSAGVIGVVDGEIDMIFANIVGVQGFIKDGKLRVIGISSAQRSPLLPTIPTIAESGLPSFADADWYAVFAPAGLPQNVLATLNAAIAKVSVSPTMKAALAKQGSAPQPDSPEQFAKFVRTDLEELATVVKQDGLRPK